MSKKVCLMCGGKAYEKPVGEATSIEGDWQCESCLFRWKKYGKYIYYVGIDHNYIAWLPVPDGLLLVFDEGNRSSAWHNKISMDEVSRVGMRRKSR